MHIILQKKHLIELYFAAFGRWARLWLILGLSSKSVPPETCVQERHTLKRRTQNVDRSSALGSGCGAELEAGAEIKIKTKTGQGKDALCLVCTLRRTVLR